MVLNPENTSFAAIIHYKLEPEIYCLKGLHAFLKIAKKKSTKFSYSYKGRYGHASSGF
jgi:hypothetical protein